MSYGHRDLIGYDVRASGSRETFVSANPWGFLVRLPDRMPELPASQQDFQYATYVPGAEDVIDDETQTVAAMDAPVVQPVRKKPDVAYPMRVGVGRTRNCDIVIRFKTVSKLHAQFHMDQPKWTLVDLDSTNGTFLNEERLVPRRPYFVPLRSKVRFGRVDLELVDAATLWDRLRAMRAR